MADSKLTHVRDAEVGPRESSSANETVPSAGDLARVGCPIVQAVSKL